MRYRHRGKIRLPAAALLVGLVCLERVVSGHHTVGQTAAGVGLGFGYFLLYSKQSWYVLGVLFLYVNLVWFFVERSFTTPAWIRKDTMELVDKKRNVPYPIKITNLLAPTFQQTRPLVITWTEVEAALDKILASIDQPLDAVVGIKTGGTILADYLRSKLKGVPVFKVKVSNKRYNCKKKDTLDDYWRTSILNIKPEYMVCEGVEKVAGNVLLIDESVASGGQMELVTEYLYEKGAKKVYRAAITSPPSIKHIYSAMKRELSPAVWPWGYDN